MAKKSVLGSLVPLIIIFFIICVLGAIGFVAYSIANDIAGKTAEKMEKKHITITKDGLKVGVKEVSREQQADKAQSVLVRAWNTSSWQYKPKWGWGQSSSTPSTPPVNAEKRNPYSRSASSNSNLPKA